MSLMPEYLLLIPDKEESKVFLVTSETRTRLEKKDHQIFKDSLNEPCLAALLHDLQFPSPAGSIVLTHRVSGIDRVSGMDGWPMAAGRHRALHYALEYAESRYSWIDRTTLSAPAQMYKQQCEAFDLNWPASALLMCSEGRLFHYTVGRNDNDKWEETLVEIVVPTIYQQARVLTQEFITQQCVESNERKMATLTTLFDPTATSGFIMPQLD